MASFHTIVAAVDFSDISGEVLRPRGIWRVSITLRLHVIHAVGDPFRSMFGRRNHRPRPASRGPPVDRSGAGTAGDTRRGASDRTGPAHDRRPLGSPANAIVKYAEEQQADLIVIGSHGRGAVSRLLLGSVAERVLHLAGRPVLVVAHRDRHLTSFEVKAAAGVGA